MGHKTFLVKLKLHGSEAFQVEAARMEVQDEHLVFLNSSGQLVALFVLEDVESWSEIIWDLPDGDHEVG
jgi:hypothetical protein